MNDTSSKEVRFFVEGSESIEIYEKLKKLAIINGKTDSQVFLKLMTEFVNSKENQKLLTEKNWVTQAELIERLQTEHNIKTNPQTLYNWRDWGFLNGLYASDGGKGLLYDYDGVALIYPTLKERPRTRTTRTRQPVSATNK